MLVNTYIRPPNWPFGPVEFQNCYLLGWAAFLAQVGSPQESAVCVSRVEVYLFLCVSIMSADAVAWHSGNEGIRPSCFDEALPGVISLQFSPFYAYKIQHAGYSLIGPRKEVFWAGIAFPLLRSAKSIIWTFSLHSRQGASRTIPTVPDLLALP